MLKDIIIISGKINSGKTSLLRTWIRDYKQTEVQPPTSGMGPGQAGSNITGILSIPVWRHGKKCAYYVFDLGTEEAVLLATEEPVRPSQKYGRFYFPSSGLRFAEKAIARVLIPQDRLSDGSSATAPASVPGSQADYLVIDEIGPLELKGEGFAPVLSRVLDAYTGTLILSIREQAVQEICTRFRISKYNRTLP